MTTIKILILTSIGIILSCIEVKSQAFKAQYTYDPNGNRLTANVIYLTTSLKSDSLSLDQVLPGSEILKPDTSGLPQKGWQPGINDNLAGLKINLYPNPTHGEILVEIIGAKDNQLLKPDNSIMVYDVQGKRVIHIDLTGRINSIDLSKQPSSSYFLRINIGGQVKEFKIIKE